MNIDTILSEMNDARVAYLLIGGVNFLLRHEPILTFDVDLWIEDTDENLRRCEAALAALNAEWGQTDATWQPTVNMPGGWLRQQGVFSLHSPHGAIDIFRYVRGLDDWSECRRNALAGKTGAGVGYLGICDEDMLKCQLALDPPSQKSTRIQSLQKHLGRQP